MYRRRSLMDSLWRSPLGGRELHRICDDSVSNLSDSDVGGDLAEYDIRIWVKRLLASPDLGARRGASTVLLRKGGGDGIAG